jgi:hypothetical protein
LSSSDLVIENIGAQGFQFTVKVIDREIEIRQVRDKRYQIWCYYLLVLSHQHVHNSIYGRKFRA